ncbi:MULTISPECIES: hypothetical protein [Streptomyces]|uniref:hypothetical protein n=1 Tax=Streptomyces TaxID=1883 RepID=UPI001670A17C|nr:hypothetical protein [Streptomyces ruber]
MCELEGVEVGRAAQGEGFPGLAGVGGLEQAAVAVVAAVLGRVAAAEEGLRADDGEARVVGLVADPLRGAVVGHGDHALVGGDVQAFVGRVDAQAVDVADGQAVSAVGRLRAGR